MIFFENHTLFPLQTAPLESIAQAESHRDIELQLVDDGMIRTLNREHRNMDYATDVLSFPLSDEHPGVGLGTIVISIDHARSKAAELGHSTEEEIQLLFLHGLLHLLGYDHETDTGQMRQKEHDLIHRFGLPESLIIRAENT